jgi:hypothetical protein
MEGVNNKQWIHPARAHDPDGPDIWRVLKTSHASRVGCRITAPVAQKTNDLWLKSLFNHRLYYPV